MDFNEYGATVTQVRSGDDITLLVDLRVDGLHKEVRARLLGVDAPDAFRAKAGSEAILVRDDVRKLTRDAQCRVVVHTANKKGWIVELYAKKSAASEEISINRLLINRGYAWKKEVKSNGT